jgi:hypothetical protein
MAEAALQEEFTFPEGGIGDFYMEDDEIEALGRLEAEEAYGSSGIANFSDVAERMASYGRHGDDTVAHVETGELVIPKALIEDNPKLRDSIFNHLEELGVENPERYVVGSGANSINPDTGLPEFFFKNIIRAVKKTAKKVTRAVKKVAKKVVKVAKKVAPIVLPFVLGPAGLGLNMMYAGALGAGIGTLIQGGDLKQAFTAALIGGAVGGVSQGVSSGMAAGKGNFVEGFTSGVKNAATNPMQSSFTQAMSASVQPATITDATAPGSVDTATKIPGTDIVDKGVSVDLLADQQVGLPGSEAGLQQASLTTTPAADAAASPTFDLSQAVDLPQKPPGFFDSVTDAFTPGGKDFLPAMKDAFLPSSGVPTVTDVMAANPGMPIDVAKQVVADASPGFLRTFAPAGAVGTGIAAAGGFFSAPEQEDLGVEDVYTPIRTGPEYELPSETPRGATGPTVVDTRYGIDPRTYLPFNPFIRPQFRTQRVAEGGEIFPRRVGGIMPDEGVPGKDSVRAMLMPGEFVMTTDAVKGLGNGDNDQGIKNMYDMMRGLEAKGRSMA